MRHTEITRDQRGDRETARGQGTGIMNLFVTNSRRTGKKQSIQ